MLWGKHVRKIAQTSFWGVLLLLACEASEGGDPVGVAETIHGLAANWPDALFSIEVQGISSGQAVIGHPVELEYEAALPGYLTYLRVSSHGDMTLVRTAAAEAKANGTLEVATAESLGTERLLVLFSNTPLDPLFTGSENLRALGADRESAGALVKQLRQLQSASIKLASRRYQYEVVAPAGGTEYTTRGITFRVLGRPNGALADERSKCPHARSKPAGAKGTTIPAHIEFEFDSDRLTRQGKLDLDEFGEALISELRDRNVELQGNTDAVGTDDYNVALSERRAMVVKHFLEESFAVASSRLKPMPMGKSNPIEPNDTEAGRACNRRVDFVFSTAPAADTSH
jgi:OOP family OmpA-OmpF porin